MEAHSKLLQNLIISNITMNLTIMRINELKIIQRLVSFSLKLFQVYNYEIIN